MNKYFYILLLLLTGVCTLLSCSDESPGPQYVLSQNKLEKPSSVSVSSITLNQTSLDLSTGSTYQLSATVNPSNATNKSVMWSSSNTDVATVSSSGLVTAKAEGTATITAVANDGSGKTATCSVSVKESVVYVSSISLSKSSLSMTVGDAESLTATVSPSNATNKNVTWSSSNTSVATVSFAGLVTAKAAGLATITATAADGSGVKATCSVTVTTGGSGNGTENGHDYVDLGLSVKWATCNVGALSPEDYGDYYAWGETQTKSTYNWSTYKWCNGSSSSMIKYCTSSIYGTVDNITQLEASDDVAHVKWKGSWRMPTMAEQDELREQCTWTWTSQGGKNGYKVTSKKNGNSIFLPAAGYRNNSDLSDVGSRGNYWSSSLHTSYSYLAYELYFNSGYVHWSYSDRDYGQSVRPVCP